MARKLKSELTLENAKAMRSAKQATGAVKEFGRASGKAGTDAAKGMDSAGASAGRFLATVGAVGGVTIGLSSLLRIVNGVAQAYDRARKAQEQFAASAMGANRLIAGSAAQYDVPEPQMRKLLYSIGGMAGAGPQDVGSLSNLLTAMGSAGMVGDITAGPKGGMAVMSGADKRLAAQMHTWQQRTGTQAQSANVVKLVAAIQGAQPGTSVQGALGMMETTYKQSLLSDWGDFLSGAATGTLGLMALGIAPDVVLSEYGSQAKFAKGGMQAAETYRMVQERFVIADDPKIVREIDREYGGGTYWKLKKEDPTQLQQMIMKLLTSPEGAERARVFGRLGVAPEMSGRIARLRAGRGKAGEIRTAIRAAGSSAARDIEWLRGGRSLQQARELAGRGGTEDRGDVVADEASLRKLLQVEQELMGETGKYGQWLSEATSFHSSEMADALEHLARREWQGDQDILEFLNWRRLYQQGGFEARPGRQTRSAWLGYKSGMKDVTEEQRLAAEAQMTDIMRGGLPQSGNVTVNNVGVQYNNTPGQVSNAPDSPQGQAIGE